MEKLRLLLKKITSIETKFCVVTLIIMLFINFAQVVLRYIFNAPFAWSEEIILMLLVWFGFICMSIDIESDRHVALTGFYDKLPKKLQYAADLLRHGMLTVFFALMVRYGYQLFRLSLRKHLPASQLSQGWQYAPMLVGGIIMCIFSCINLICTILHIDIQQNVKDC